LSLLLHEVPAFHSRHIELLRLYGSGSRNHRCGRKDQKFLHGLDTLFLVLGAGIAPVTQIVAPLARGQADGTANTHY